ncbi:MAG: hypothetical protein JNM56_32925 [Planctomycetia bacterium]|nr:hypothetical protein [Planctomycetia bacterium]
MNERLTSKIDTLLNAADEMQRALRLSWALQSETRARRALQHLTGAAAALRQEMKQPPDGMGQPGGIVVD